MLLVFMSGVYLWRLFIARDEGASGVAVVARNSLAPIILNLFNRGIDFGFAFIMLRILGPDGSGIYFYAAFIFGWFDIFTNFGLNVFLTREVSRDRAAGVAAIVQHQRAAADFDGRRRDFADRVPDSAADHRISPPLVPEAVIAICLLYIGLMPNSLSTGTVGAVLRLREGRNPAAITTIATISKAIFGVAALALGYGVVGLAAVSIITNCITLAVMVSSGARTEDCNPQPQFMAEDKHPEAVTELEAGLGVDSRDGRAKAGR